jgi:hypothetical protein
LKHIKNGIEKVSTFISWLAEFKCRCHWISNQTTDNADPECEASECLEHLGLLLAVLNIYEKEYTEDPINEQTGKIVRE